MTSRKRVKIFLTALVLLLLLAVSYLYRARHLTCMESFSREAVPLPALFVAH